MTKVEKAEALFRSGMNCSQSVFCAYADEFGMDEETAAKVLPVAKKIAALMQEKLGCDGLNLVQNNGEVAGQTVKHFHLHVIPRYEGDGQTILWKPTEPAAEELDGVLAKLK